MSTLAVDKATNVAGTAFYNLMDFDTVKSASTTVVDFTGIPSWVKRVTVMFQGVSTNGTSNYLVQLGTSGGIVSTGYISAASAPSGSATATSGFVLSNGVAAADTAHGFVSITNLTGNTWVLSGVMANGGNGRSCAGSIALASALTQLRITTVTGTDTFDAGSINLLYEGYNV